MWSDLTASGGSGISAISSYSNGSNKVPMIHYDDFENLLRRVVIDACSEIDVIKSGPIFVHASDGNTSGLGDLFRHLKFKGPQYFADDLLLSSDAQTSLWGADISFSAPLYGFAGPMPWWCEVWRFFNIYYICFKFECCTTCTVSRKRTRISARIHNSFRWHLAPVLEVTKSDAMPRYDWRWSEGGEEFLRCNIVESVSPHGASKYVTIHASSSKNNSPPQEFPSYYSFEV